MQRIAMLPLTAALTLALAAPGFGQGAGTTGQAEGKASAQAQEKAAAPAQEKAPALQAESEAQAQARVQAEAQAKVEARKSLETIKQRGAKASAAARKKTDAKLEAAATRTNETAAVQGETQVAGRLAADFGMSADDLIAERQALGCSWGDLMIAHSLDANSTTEVTAAQLVELHKEGTGWGQIAAGLGLNLGQVVSGVQSQSQVAAGLARPDGKPAVIRGEGARAGVAAGAGARAGGTSATAQTGVGVGVKIKP